jgi:hypothetical protein
MRITGSTINLSTQAELTKVTPTELNDIANGSGIIYLNESNENMIPTLSESYPALGFATNDGSIVESPYPGMIILNLPVPEIPTVFPVREKAYALGLVEVDGEYALKWVLVDTNGDFNTYPPSYYVVSAVGAFCYYYDEDLDDVYPTGYIAVTIDGWDVNVPKKYSLDGGLTFTGIITESYYLTYSSFEILKLGNNPTGQTIDLVISDSYDYVLYSDTLVVDAPQYQTVIPFAGTVPNLDYDVNLVKEQDISASSPAAIIRVYVTDLQPNCEYYYEIWDYWTATMLFNQDYSSSKTATFAIASGGGPDIRMNAIVYKKVPGRIQIEGIDTNNDATIDIPHTALLYSKDDPNPANYTGVTPGAAYTELVYNANEAEGEKNIYMKESMLDCIYKETIVFTQTGASITTTPMLILDYDGDIITDGRFNNMLVSTAPVLRPLNTYFNPIKVLGTMFGGGTSLIFSFTYTGIVSSGDTAEVLFYDAVSGEELVGTGSQTPIIDTTLGSLTFGFTTIDVKYGTYYALNLGQRIMIRFRYIESSTLIYNLSDLIYLDNV